MSDDLKSELDQKIISQERNAILTKGSFTSLQVALGALMTALETVSTILLSIYIPQTNGYFNLGDSVIFITALLFGAYIGGFTGAFGAGLADVILGYYMYAPITFVVKGLEGLVVGWIYEKFRTNPNGLKKFSFKLLAIICGAPFMVGGYFLAEFFILSYGWAAAAELIPNLLQVGLGAVIALPIVNLLECVPIITSIREKPVETPVSS